MATNVTTHVSTCHQAMAYQAWQQPLGSDSNEDEAVDKGYDMQDDQAFSMEMRE